MVDLTQENADQAGTIRQLRRLLDRAEAVMMKTVSHSDAVADDLKALLEHNLHAIHPSNGKQNAQIVSDICERHGLDRTKYLPRHVLRDPQRWGLT